MALKEFKNLSVALKMRELAHTRSIDEHDADINAMKIYLGLGNTINEAQEVFCKVFKENPRLKERLEVLKKYIKDFDVKNPI